MFKFYQRGKLSLTALVVIVLAVLLGGCVGIKDRFVPSGMAGRMAPLSDQISIAPPPGSGNGSLLLACGLKEVSPREAGLDPEAFWQDSQIAALQTVLAARGFKLTFGAMRAFSSESVKLGFLPFGSEDGAVKAGIAFEERSGRRSAVALVQQTEGTLNIYPDGGEELWQLLSSQAVQDLVAQLRRDEPFQAFERELAAQGKRVSPQQSLGATTVGKGLLYLLCEAGGKPSPDFEERLAQVKQALKLIQSIDPDRIREWLSALQRTLMEEGEDRFRQEYESLLSQEDFVELVAASLMMAGEVPVSAEPDQVTREIIVGILSTLGAELIKGLLTPPPPGPKDAHVWLFQWNLKREYEQRLKAAWWTKPDQALWQRFEELWDRFVLVFGSPHKEALTVAIYLIAQNMIQNLALPPLALVWLLPVGVNANVNTGLRSFADFLQWALVQGDPGMPPVDRREQAMGTLFALSMFALGGRWHMHGFLVGGVNVSHPQSWAAGLAYLPSRDKNDKQVISGFDKNIVLLLRGDHCTNCGTEDKIKKIIDWVETAIKVVGESWFHHEMYPETRNERIIALVFTNENATGLDKVFQALQQKFDDKDVAIIMINFEQQPGGTVTVNLTCIGKKCGELERKGVLDRIKRDYSKALGLAMRAYPGYSPTMAWHLAYGVCGGDPDCIKFLMEALEEELGPEEEPCPPAGPGVVCLVRTKP